MGYEAMTGRLPDAVALQLPRQRAGRHWRRWTAGGSTRPREAIRTVAAGIRGARLHGQARPPVLHLVPVPGDLPVQRGALSVDGARGRRPAGDRGRPGGPRAGRGRSRPTTSRRCASLPDGCVDLAYADPPFATGGSQRLTSIRTGRGEATRRGFGGRTYRYEVVSDMAWPDDLPLDQHLEALHARLVEVQRVLAAHGSLYLHVDWRTAHHARLLLDEVFGPERFLNEIVWAYDYGGRARDRWPRKHDTILWYAKGEAWTFEREAIDRIPYLAPGLVGPEKAARGKLPTDVWWMTIVPPGSAERTGYPTQKPVRLLERIVAASSRPGDLVLDPYAGSGTTGVAAARLGRRWLLVDRNPAAVEIARARLAAEVRVVTSGPGAAPGDHRHHARLREHAGPGARPPACARSSQRTAAAMAERLGPFDVDEVLAGLGRGARAPVPRGGAAVPRGRPRAADRPRPGAAARA